MQSCLDLLMAGCSYGNDCYSAYRKLLKDVSEGGWSINSSRRRWLLSISLPLLFVSHRIYANGALICVDALKTAAAVSIAVGLTRRAIGRAHNVRLYVSETIIDIG